MCFGQKWLKTASPATGAGERPDRSVRVMYMYAASLLSELGTVRMHKGLYQDSIDVPSSPLSLLVPSQMQHFESTSSIKQPRPCLSPAAMPRRERRTAHTERDPLTFSRGALGSHLPLPSLLFFLSGRDGLVMGEQGRTDLGLRTAKRCRNSYKFLMLWRHQIRQLYVNFLLCRRVEKVGRTHCISINLIKV